MKVFSPKTIAFFLLYCLPVLACAQSSTNTNGSGANAIPTAVPFLNISPDSRSGAMGDAGVALSPDVNANYWNPAKLAFLENTNDFSISYTPWLRQLVPDISLSNVSYAHKLSERNTFGVSLRYFNLGSIEGLDDLANTQGNYNPNEFALDGSFARKFGNNFSLGLTLRYIYSNFSSGAFVTGSGQLTGPGNSVAAGVSLYYTKPYGDGSVFSFGTHVSNIGPKISYSSNDPSYFLPTNLKIGAANTWRLDALSKFTLTLDLNKLLVPTPARDANGLIAPGYYNISVPSGIFRSFTDAPGGFSEELKEITLSPAVEYSYNDLLAIRAGYFYENPAKGNRHYLTLGVGLKYQAYNFDFSYVAASQQSTPLANTLRFTLTASFGSISAPKPPAETPAKK